MQKSIQKSKNHKLVGMHVKDSWVQEGSTPVTPSFIEFILQGSSIHVMFSGFLSVSSNKVCFEVAPIENIVYNCRVIVFV